MLTWRNWKKINIFLSYYTNKSNYQYQYITHGIGNNSSTSKKYNRFNFKNQRYFFHLKYDR